MEEGRSWHLFFFPVSNAIVDTNFILFIMFLHSHRFPIECWIKGKLFSKVPPSLWRLSSLKRHSPRHPCSHLAKWLGAEPFLVSSCCTCSPYFLQNPSPVSTWQREACCPSLPPGAWPFLLLWHPLHPGSLLPPILSTWIAIIFHVCPSWNHKLPEDSFMFDSSLYPQLLAQCLALEYSQEVFKWINECKHRPNQMLSNALRPVQEIFLTLGSWWL